MPHVRLTENIQRHVTCPARDVEAPTVKAALDAYFQHVPTARGYVLDDQGHLRKHMLVFVNGEQVQDRIMLTDSIAADATIDVMQALSGC